MSVARYTTGTCQINGAGAVVGSGSLWAVAVTPGDEFGLTISGPFYEVITVTDNTHIVVDPAPSTTGSGQSYVIKQNSPLRGSIAQNNILLTAFRTQLGSILDISSADKKITLNKTAASDNCGLVLQQGGTSLFQVGAFGNGSGSSNRFRIQYLVSATWTDALAVDVTTGKVGIGVSAATQRLDVVDSSVALALWDNASAATGRGGAVLLQASNATPARITFASINAYVTTTTAAAEVGDLVFKTMRAGTLTEAARFLGAGNLLSNINGTAAAPIWAWVSEPNSGPYRIGAFNIGFSINGTKVLDIAASVFKVTGATSQSAVVNSADGNPSFILQDNGTPGAQYTIFASNTYLDYEGVLSIRSGVGGTIRSTLSAAGVLNLAATTASTSVSTGVLTLAGGLGVAGSIFAGSLTLTGATAVTGTINSADGNPSFLLKDNGTAGFQAALFSGGTFVDYQGTLSFRSGVGGTVRAALNASGVMTLSALATGSLTSVSGVITSSSDETLKTVKGPFERSIADLLKMDSAILYNWNEASGLDQRETFAGWTAQGVRKGIPEAIHVGPDGKLSLSERPILAATVNGVIDHERRLAALESRIH